ncbi:MAG: hypothetical protein Q3962_06730 [Corynebacterium sp.]|nr:hypothetical protein [Corynebacterium sp.]
MIPELLSLEELLNKALDHGLQIEAGHSKRMPYEDGLAIFADLNNDGVIDQVQTIDFQGESTFYSVINSELLEVDENAAPDWIGLDFGENLPDGTESDEDTGWVRL